MSAATTLSRPTPRREQQPARGILVALAAVACASAAWAALGGAGCRGCASAAQRQALLPLPWIGLIYYATLAALATWGRKPGWTNAAFFAAAGVHAVLLANLVRLQILCIPCIIAATAALLGSGVSGITRPRALFSSMTVFAFAWLVAYTGLHAVRPLTTPPATSSAQTLPTDETLPAVPKGHVRVILYEREGCYDCMAFENQFMPKLQAAFGESLLVIRRNALDSMQTPTIIVQGNGEKTFSGVPGLEELTAALKENQIR